MTDRRWLRDLTAATTTYRDGMTPHEYAVAILEALSPEWMLVRKDESIWKALANDPAFQIGMAQAEADMAAGRVVKYELVPADELARLRYENDLWAPRPGLEGGQTS
jgi:hypothetical protein